MRTKSFATVAREAETMVADLCGRRIESEKDYNESESNLNAMIALLGFAVKTSANRVKADRIEVMLNEAWMRANGIFCVRKLDRIER